MSLAPWQSWEYTMNQTSSNGIKINYQYPWKITWTRKSMATGQPFFPWMPHQLVVSCHNSKGLPARIWKATGFWDLWFLGLFPETSLLVRSIDWVILDDLKVLCEPCVLGTTKKGSPLQPLSSSPSAREPARSRLPLPGHEAPCSPSMFHWVNSK